MDPTQSFDPNRTQLTGVPGAVDPNRTMIGGPGFDPYKTQAIQGQDPLAGWDQRTAAMAAMPAGPALAVQIIPGREAQMANGPAREQFLLDISAPGVPGMPLGGGAGMRTPLNLCLVIDRSGSMEGAPLEYAKPACAHVVDLLSPNDVLSIVTFEETVDLLMPAQRVTDRQRIKDGIMRLVAGNTTHLHGGLTMALQQVLSFSDPGRATRLVVLTDGDPTAGIKDFPTLTQFAAEIKQKGVTITFLGFGPDYNEELLAGMAKKAGGNYYFIAQPALIPEVFRNELDKMLTTVARNLSLTFKPARWVTCRAPQQASSGQEFVVTLADMERGSTVQQVLDLEFQNHPLGWYRVASGRLTYDDTVNGKTEAVDLDFVIEFTADSARYSVPADVRVAQAAQVAAASRVVEKTILGMKTGQLSAAGAMQELQKTQALLLTQGRTADAQEVTMALRALQSGDQTSAEKTLLGTVFNLDQGKK